MYGRTCGFVCQASGNLGEDVQGQQAPGIFGFNSAGTAARLRGESGSSCRRRLFVRSLEPLERLAHRARPRWGLWRQPTRTRGRRFGGSPHPPSAGVCVLEPEALFFSPSRPQFSFEIWGDWGNAPSPRPFPIHPIGHAGRSPDSPSRTLVCEPLLPGASCLNPELESPDPPPWLRSPEAAGSSGAGKEARWTG